MSQQRPLHQQGALCGLDRRQWRRSSIHLRDRGDWRLTLRKDLGICAFHMCRVSIGRMGLAEHWLQRHGGGVDCDRDRNLLVLLQLLLQQLLLRLLLLLLLLLLHDLVLLLHGLVLLLLVLLQGGCLLRRTGETGR